VDALRARGAIEGFTAVLDHRALGQATEALIELFYAPGTLLDDIAARFASHPEIVEAWSVTGDADAIARVRTSDNADLERLIMDLQRNGLVVRTRSQVVLSQLVSRPTTGI
jgi:DNA-binding Lrp family transcriptional regulator